MANSSPRTLFDALAPFWRMSSLSSFNNIMKDKHFSALKNYCIAHYSSVLDSMFIDIPLTRALCLAGAPCFAGGNPSTSTITEVAAFLDTELTKTTATKIYLSPLDCASTIASFRFGNAEIRTFTTDELYVILGQQQLERLSWHKKSDLNALAQFTWLMVKDTVAVDPDITRRNYNFLDQDFAHDYGAIKPYYHHYPDAFKHALFVLLLAPWEVWVGEHSVEWRAFLIRWVHTVEDDLLIHPEFIPDADSLTWEPRIYTGAHGETIETNEPLELPLFCQDDEPRKHVHDQLLENTKTAIQNGLINEAAKHHFLKAFLSDGVDEFLAHIVVIDACLGDPEELKEELINVKVKGKCLPPTAKLKYRLVGLLNDISVKKEIDNLYMLRSKYVHGRDMHIISSQEKKQARSLARRTLFNITEIASSHSDTNKTQLLNTLLTKGHDLMS